MQQVLLTVRSNERLTSDVFRMELTGDVRAITSPGQFLNFRLDGFSLRRPISVCDVGEGSVTVVYRVVGGGTAAMAKLRSGAVLDTLTGLGNGFDASKSGDTPLLIGGGVGTPPLVYLCRMLREEGKRVKVVLGFRTASDVLLEEEFRALGAEVYIATEDGSFGTRGFVTDVMKTLDYSYFYTCGPMPMYRAVERTAVTDGQYSFEERMGCGFGACMGCSCQTLFGSKRICTDGPVFERKEILWEAQV